MRRGTHLTIAQAWKLLGLEPCDDERAVKSAYAAKLKAIDPDKDIEGFGRLRDALRIARDDARWRKREAEQGADDPAGPDADYADEYDDDPHFSSGGDFFAPERDLSNALANPATVAAFDAPIDYDAGEVALPSGELAGELGTSDFAPEIEEVEPDPLQKHFSALHKHLSASPFTEEDDLAVRGAVQAILADDRLEGIEFAEYIEAGLADHLRYTIPNSDSAIRLADAHFGWRDEVSKANPRWHILDLGQRADDLACIDILSDPAHKWHEAYLALSYGPPKTLPFADRMRVQPRVAEVIESLRRHHPDLLREFDQEALDRWAELNSATPAPELIDAEGISWFGWVVIIFVIAQIAKLVMEAM